jgi:hypothetical protein
MIPLFSLLLIVVSVLVGGYFIIRGFMRSDKTNTLMDLEESYEDSVKDLINESDQIKRSVKTKQNELRRARKALDNELKTTKDFLEND